MLANEPYGGGNLPVLHRQHIGRTTGNDCMGSDVRGDRLQFFARHQPVQQRGGLISDAFSVGYHAGKRRIGQVAEHLLVIHADHRQVIGYRHPGGAAGVEHLLTAHVIAGHQAHGFWHPGNPACDQGAVLEACLFVGGGVELPWRQLFRKHVAAQTGGGNQLHKAVPPFI